MRQAWELFISGPADSDRSVLLLPGGANAARSYGLVMTQPVLADVRMVATTLPGMAGAPLTSELTIEAMADRACRIAAEETCDVVVGFSHGATVALEMVLSGGFQGPVVLLGISLSTEDEAGFFRYLVRASQRVGPWPLGLLLKLMPMVVRSAKLPDRHKRELLADLKQNRARDAVAVSAPYLDYIAADRDYAAELADLTTPVWIVHAEKKGDGGLTGAERDTLAGSDNVSLVTIPGAVFLIPDEAPGVTAEVIAAAIARVG